MLSDSAVYVAQSFNIKVCGLLQRADLFVSLQQRKTLFEAGKALLAAGSAHTTAGERFVEVDVTIFFFCYMMLENLSKLVSKDPLSTLRKE